MSIFVNSLRPHYLFALRRLSSTVIHEEIAHFDGLCTEWWNLEGTARTLHLMNKVRIGFLMRGLLNTARITEQQLSSPKPLASMKVLDAGCGGGILSEALARLGADVTGVDASEVLIDVAKSHASKNPSLSNINYTVGTMEEFCKEHREEFDIVISSEVIEHLNEKELFLQCCAHTLKPGGPLVVTTLTKTWLAYISAIIFAENVWKIIPKNTHHWNLLIKPKELKKLLRACGCSPIFLNGHHFSMLLGTWFWSPVPTVFYAIFSIKK